MHARAAGPTVRLATAGPLFAALKVRVSEIPLTEVLVVGFGHAGSPSLPDSIINDALPGSRFGAENAVLRWAVNFDCGLMDARARRALLSFAPESCHTHLDPCTPQSQKHITASAYAQSSCLLH